jgi:hypothetical protein
MVSWAVKDYGGEIPRRESRLLPDNNAEEAVNCDLSSGDLQGLPIPNFVIDLGAGIKRAYRFPLAGQADVWLALPSPFSSACRSPLANDTQNRVYWTNPTGYGADGAYWNTRARINAGNTGANAPYNLGTVQPDPNTSSLTITAVGGTAGVPEVERSYTWTYVNAYGEESAPNAPSAVVAGEPDATWTVSGLPTTAPSNPVGKNYPPIVGINIYRTSTGTNTGAQFYQIGTFAFTAPSSYVDAVPDTTAVNNLTLVSAAFANPLDNLDGLTALPGGMLVGFTGNTVHFCEPDRPHAWPAAYDQSLQYQIVGFGVWQQSLVVLTSGFPSTGSGNSPSNFIFTQVRVPEPCIARGSIITDLMGVYYASQNGLVMLNYFGMQNQTLTTMTKNIWLQDYVVPATGILACRHRAQYLAVRVDGSGTGFLIDYAEQRMGVMELSTFTGATAIWNDEFSGDAYVCAGGKVYRWDDPTTGPLTFRWRSKQFYGPAPVSLGACQISLDPSVETPPPSPNTQTLGNGDSTLVLPNGVNAVFNLYAGPNGGHKVFSRNLSNTREIFRLPSGFKAFDWQCEIVSRVKVHSIELATTMRELKGV